MAAIGNSYTDQLHLEVKQSVFGESHQKAVRGDVKCHPIMNGWESTGS